jgi:SNW domain-containing protein 1
MNVALNKIVDKKVRTYAPKMDNMGRVMEGPAFVRYTPTAGDGETRIIKMVNAPVDPLEPPKFGHKKIPRGPPSPPPPVLHSPPRKV